MDERTQASLIADRLLDEPYADPDDDIRVVARQFNRSQEEIDRLQKGRAAAIDRLTPLGLEIERLKWLIAHGEERFGSLWREATEADIEIARKGAS